MRLRLIWIIGLQVDATMTCQDEVLKTKLKEKKDIQKAICRRAELPDLFAKLEAVSNMDAHIYSTASFYLKKVNFVIVLNNSMSIALFVNTAVFSQASWMSWKRKTR